MAAFVLFDTHNIIEKVRAGNNDIVQHALDLFFDVLSMFRRLIIILTQKVFYLYKIYKKIHLTHSTHFQLLAYNNIYR